MPAPTFARGTVLNRANDRNGDATEFARTQVSGAAAGRTGTAAGNALPAGYQLHEFRIEGVIGEGGFGIVYRAHDVQLQRTVAMKEYMPASLAGRRADQVVSVRSEHQRETFELGMRSFINEARMLASFDHPSLVKVYRFWEQNGTAYMVMPFYDGPTLKAVLGQLPAPPDEAWLKQLLGPLLDALQIIHADHCYHRDVAPDNILLLGPQQKPLLLDFGAARRVIGDATQSLTVILKPGYAPIEQYAEVPSMTQGAWTDVYALCAVLYRAITGDPPTPSVGRIIKDDMVPVAQIAQGRYSEPFLAGIDAGLAVRPQDRPQDVAALRALLFACEVPVDEPGDAASTGLRGPAAAGPAAAAPAQPVAAPQPPLAAEPARRMNAALVLAGAVGLIAAGGIGWFATRQSPAPPAALQVATPAPSPAPSPAPAPAPSRGAFTLVAALEDIVRHADPLISVNTLADKESVAIGRDRIQFRVKSSEAGYLYVFLCGTDGAHLSLLFPNAIDGNNHVDADGEVALPRKGWQITASGPPGVNHIVAMVSRSPRDFAAAGLKAGAPISEFDTGTVERLWDSAPANVSPYAGAVRCAGADPCDAAFGATLLHISEVAAPK